MTDLTNADIFEFLYDEYGIAVKWNAVRGKVFVRFNNQANPDIFNLDTIKSYLEVKRGIFGKPSLPTKPSRIFKSFKKKENN